MVLFHVGSQSFGFTAGNPVQALPEKFPVIFVNGVGKFVQDHVIRQILRQAHQMDIQIDMIGN
jgi:hypothetical protein